MFRRLNAERDGTQSVEIGADQISYRALLRMIRKVPGALVKSAAYDPMNDNARIVVEYRGATISIETPFSDYIVNCSCPSHAFDDFIAVLAEHRVRWWERFI
jgi:hypothetical protein